MNLVMTSTPLAVVGCGFTKDNAADVVMAHVLAMFAPSFFTGHLINRFGVERIMGLGLVILAGAGGVALAGVALENFFIALILLGLGWNFGFIGATTMLASAHTVEERGRVQGLNDMIVFGCVTVASLASGGLMNCSGGSPVEGWTAVNLAMLPFLALAGAALLLFARFALAIRFASRRAAWLCGSRLFRSGGRSGRLRLGLRGGFSTACFFLGLRLKRLFAFPLFPFLGLGLGTATLPLFGARFLVSLALSGLIGLAGFRGGERLHPAFKLCLRDPARPLRRITARDSATATRSLSSVGFRYNDTLALGLDHDILRAPVAEALLHLARTGAATKAEGLFAVSIAHQVLISFPVDAPPFTSRTPSSREASSTTRLLSLPGAKALCMT
jgi:MFS family permease